MTATPETFLPTAEVLADSVTPWGQRLTSFKLVYHRYIHCELLTHRVFSRSSSSSRAVPVKKNLDKDICYPLYWGLNEKGMQATNQVTDPGLIASFRQMWYHAWGWAKSFAEALSGPNANIHKQTANRLVEPFLPIHTILTGSHFSNFFRLRCSPLAQPELQYLAYAMLGQYLGSTPVCKQPSEWHLPFGDRMDPAWSEEDRLAVATARAARISYEAHDGAISLEKDLWLFQQLKAREEWGPFEHQARVGDPNDEEARFRNQHTRANFDHGWEQHRKLIDSAEGLRNAQTDLTAIYSSRPDWIKEYEEK